MTVIDVFLDRPKVVPKQRIIGTKNRKSFQDLLYMPGIQECIVNGNFLPNSLNLMDRNGGSTPELDADAETFKKNKDEEDGPPKSSQSVMKRQKILVKATRTPIRNRRKSRWKLKFHHQALPPEYLKHYKQQERKIRQTETGSLNRKQIRKSVKKLFSETRGKPKMESTDVIVVDTKEGLKSEDRGSPNGNGLLGSEKVSRFVTPETSIFCPDSKDAKEQEKKRPFHDGSSNVSSSTSSSPSSPSYHEFADNFLHSSGLSGISSLKIDVSQNKAFLENLLTNQIEINRVVCKDRKSSTTTKSLQSQYDKRRKNLHQPENKKKIYPIPNFGKIMNYSDLPYMGEITLDGIKPRRGRKPKKADICHLIYKNYGHVFPGAPSKECDENTSAKKLKKWRPEVKKAAVNSSQKTKRLSESVATNRPDSPLPSISGLINHSEVQNRIINSLLEKRLTQEMKFMSRLSKIDQKSNTEEPLNLCIRDLKSLKIELTRKRDIFDEATSLKDDANDRNRRPEVMRIGKSDSEVESTDENDEDDLAPFNLVTTELRELSDEDTLLNLGDQVTLTKIKNPPKKEEMKSPKDRPSNITSPMLFWQSGGLLLPNISPLSRFENLSNRTIFPGSESTVHDLNTESEGKNQTKRLASVSNTSKPLHAITKRKRSAIFIPPVPAESSANPTTEVSICKFKFTGGAKPSLQKKKMLSVDSGGNFRYYSGTGDKSMRGYEYFPRESLQQCQENTGCSPSGVFLTASALGSGEKIPEEIGHSGFFESDFPPQISVPKSDETSHKTRLDKVPEGGNERSGAVFCKTVREHLLKGGSDDGADFVPAPDESEKEEGNFSDQSEREFEAGALPPSYFDVLKMRVEGNRGPGKFGEGVSRTTRHLRKTRKSIAREKLEQTFKEKGFLIQTQQLESAEGATYCKFRQLRKFTRYLFRSWKDYLPGNVRNLSVDAGVENPEIVIPIPETETNVKKEVTNSTGNEPFK